MKKTISILHLEDQLPDSILVKALIGKEFSPFIYYFADDESEFLETLKKKSIDIILSDYQLPDYSGSEALAVAKNQYPDIPFIFVTGQMGEDAAIESLLNGATDYVMKSKLERLVPAMKRALYEAELLKDRSDAHKALRESEEKFRSVAESANDAIVTANSAGIILGWNKGAEKIFGYSEAEVTGKALTTILPPSYGKNHQGNIERVVNGGERHAIGKTVELTALHKSGHEFPIELSLADWDTASGKFFTGIIRDITRRKQDEATLLKAKEKAEASDRLKTAFIRNISHEIRTPLNGILGMYQMLTDPGNSWQEKQEYYAHLRSSSDRLIKTVTDYLDSALLVSGNMAVNESMFSPEALLNEIHINFHHACEARHLEFIFQPTNLPQTFQIESDQTLLRNVLTQLIDNAIKFTDQGSVTIGLERQGDQLEFFVKDTGIGIDKKSQAGIFDAFVQESASTTRVYEGSGLGLTITKGLVKLLGGEIRLESAKGGGSSFYITIPCKTATTEKNSALV
jgi:PAS domain S-box-containing protein